MHKALLPLARGLPRGERRLLVAATGLLIALVAATAAHATLGIGGRAVELPIRDWVTSAVYILVGLIVSLRAPCAPPRRGARG